MTEDGLFDGHISTPEEYYYIEPASKYFSTAASEADDEAGDVKQPFHSVIYKASDVIHPILDNYDDDGEVGILFIFLKFDGKSAIFKKGNLSCTSL